MHELQFNIKKYINKFQYLVSFLFSLMKKGNEKNQENLTLYSLSLVSQHFVGTQNFHAFMKVSIGSSFESKAAKQTKIKFLIWL